MSEDHEWVEPNRDREVERRRELDSLRRRVKELEDALLYLSNTLATHGVISPTEADPARRMHDRGIRIDQFDGWRP